MAVFDFEVYADTPDWKDVGANTLVFASSLTDLATNITVGAFNDGTHLGNGDPGTDQCGTNHVPNVKWISSTQFDADGGGTETLNDTNLVQTECTERINFTDGSSVTISSARFYSYDGVTETDEAVGIDAFAFEQGVSATTWTQINDDDGNIGGDNSGERLQLTDQGAATEHTYYIAISASPESVGAKGSFDFGVALTYS